MLAKSKNRFLVTGGAGFIGSHLVEKLLLMGYEVIVIDNFSTGKTENLKSFSGSNHLRIIDSSVEDYDLDDITCDGVFHLAAQASVPISISASYTSSICNLVTSIKILDYCRNLGIPLIYASSSAVYGNMLETIEDGKVELLSPYAVDKYALELYAQQYSVHHSVKSIGFRFFNVYGPRQDPDNPYSGVVSVFANNILKDLPIKIFGGDQTRDFIFVTDVIECLVKGMFDLFRLSENVADVINIGTGSEITINYLVELLQELTSRKAEIFRLDYTPGDPMRSTCSRIRLLDFSSDMIFKTMEEGLSIYLESINNEL